MLQLLSVKAASTLTLAFMYIRANYGDAIFVGLPLSWIQLQSIEGTAARPIMGFQSLVIMSNDMQDVLHWLSNV